MNMKTMLQTYTLKFATLQKTYKNTRYYNDF